MKLFERMKHKNFALFVLVVLLVMPLVFVSGGCNGGSSSDFSAAQKAHRTYKIKAGGEFKVLQLTDIHLTGAPENIEEVAREQGLEPGMQDVRDGCTAYDRDMFALETVDAVIKQAKPDFIAVTGDLAYVNEGLQKPLPNYNNKHWLNVGHNDNMKPIQRFVDLIESYNIPWAFVYGNHDAEGLHGREELGNYFEGLKNCVFEKGPENVSGVGNYVVNVENSDGTLNKALVFIDSNSYMHTHTGLSDLGNYDHIHGDQLDWYENEIANIAQEYGLDGKTPESFCFWHIPLVEYKTAWEGLKNSSGKFSIYNYDNFPSTMWEDGYNNEGVCHPNRTVEGAEDGGHMFERILAVGSTKAIFCGHDHINYSNVKYKGVNLVYGKSIDYTAYAPMTTDTQRGGTLITIKDGGEWHVSRVDFHGNLYKKFLEKNNKLGTYPKPDYEY